MPQRNNSVSSIPGAAFCTLFVTTCVALVYVNLYLQDRWSVGLACHSSVMYDYSFWVIQRQHQSMTVYSTDYQPCSHPVHKVVCILLNVENLSIISVHHDKNYRSHMMYLWCQCMGINTIPWHLGSHQFVSVYTNVYCYLCLRIGDNVGCTTTFHFLQIFICRPECFISSLKCTSILFVLIAWVQKWTISVQ